MTTNNAADRFRAAVEARDIESALHALADDVTFHSPAVHKAYRGKDTTSTLLRLVFETFEDFSYTDQLANADGTHALIFRARVGDRELEGLDLVRLDADDRIADFTVMIRPLSGLIALAQQMGPKVEAAGLSAG